MSRVPSVKSGDRFGRLLVIQRAERRQTWWCACDCGELTKAYDYNMRAGRTRSCGCLMREATGRRSAARVAHGHYKGDRASRTYKTWQSMKTRCTNPQADQWKWYGARGIGVCDRWLNSFEAFLEDMGERPDARTLDRIDVDGNYEPGNCRWATALEQAANKRPRL